MKLYLGMIITAIVVSTTIMFQTGSLTGRIKSSITLRPGRYYSLKPGTICSITGDDLGNLHIIDLVRLSEMLLAIQTTQPLFEKLPAPEQSAPIEPALQLMPLSVRQDDQHHNPAPL